MKPIKFPEHNVVFAKNQPQYQPLPVLKYSSPEGDVVSCWALSWKERFRILFSGRIWLCLMTFNDPLQPIYMTTKKAEVVIGQNKS
jgi:hypothetical protein